MTNALLRLIVAFRPLEYIDGLTIPDDAYLSLTIARNIANGLGPLYGADFTNGFQPLYVFLMVPVFWLEHGDQIIVPVHVALLLLTLFDTAALYLLFRYCVAWSASWMTPILVAAAWVFNPYVMVTTLNGLETAISFFFIVLTIILYHQQVVAVPGSLATRQALLLGAVLGLAVLSRIDNLFLALTIIALIVWRFTASELPRRLLLKTVATVAGAALVIQLPWLMYSYSHTGDVYPVSGRAVRFMSLANVDHAPTLGGWYIPLMQNAVQVIRSRHMLLLIMTGALLLLLLVMTRRTFWRAVGDRLYLLSPSLLFSSSLLLAYVLYIFAPWFFDRYLFPVTILFLTCLAVAADSCLSEIRSARNRARLGALIFVLLVGASALDQDFRRLFTSKETKTLGYMNLGVWAKRYFPNGTVLGSSQTGALGYFADNLTVINLDGVVNKQCLESLVRKANMEYLRSAHVEYVIGWPVNLSFIAKHSTGFRREDLQLVTKIEEFKSWGQEWHVLKVNDPEK